MIGFALYGPSKLSITKKKCRKHWSKKNVKEAVNVAKAVESLLQICTFKEYNYYMLYHIL